MQQASRHYWKASLKQWKWIPEENSIEESYVEVEKDFSSKELKKHLKIEKLKILACSMLSGTIGTLGFFGNWIIGLSMVGICFMLALLGGIILYYLDNYKNPYHYDLGYQDYIEDTRLTYIFAEELAQLKEQQIKQEELAKKWRKKHPLEEKIRLALTKNPNYIADLLRYCELVKPNKKSLKQLLETEKERQEKKQEKDNQTIKVKYLGDEI